MSSFPVGINARKRSAEANDMGFRFNDDIEKGFKSQIYLVMENMIENVKKYQDDFKGGRIPTFEQKFLHRKAERKVQVAQREGKPQGRFQKSLERSKRSSARNSTVDSGGDAPSGSPTKVGGGVVDVQRKHEENDCEEFSDNAAPIVEIERSPAGRGPRRLGELRALGTAAKPRAPARTPAGHR